MRFKWIFISISLVLVLGSLFFIAMHGMNFGVDFKGGIKLVYQFQTSPDDRLLGDENIRTLLEPLGLGDTQIVRFGKESDNSFLIKTKFQENRDVQKEITSFLGKELGQEKVILLSEESVGPRVGADLRKRGTFAIVLTWILILIYIGWRFDFLFAPGAVVALLHDVIVALGFFTLFHKEFSLSILAAVLTLIGYSVNDTIVIYDRVRENLRKLPVSVPLADLVNVSVNETLSRSIITSLTVLFAMIILFIFGGGVIHDFAFFMIVGVIAGSYSTIFIASPVYLALHKLFPKKGIVRGTGKR